MVFVAISITELTVVVQGGTEFYLFEFFFKFQRTCWWNEVCKEEFQLLFRCRCPQWSYCRSPGRYYNAFCSMTNTGYIWTQPKWDWTNP